MIDDNAIPEPNSGCSIWLGAVQSKGYGSVKRPKEDGGGYTSAHKRRYEEEHGPIPAGCQVRHTCGMKLCVQIGHLKLGTQSDNEQDKRRHGTYEASHIGSNPKMFCKRGHPIRGEGADVWIEKNGKPHCNICRRLRYGER